MSNQQLYTRTPSVVVLDNRGSTIREINYCRHPDTVNQTDERITRHHYHARGYLECSIDARLYDTQQADSTIQPNIQQTVSLGGALSFSQGVDNGNSFNINDIEGAIAQQINAKGTVTTYEYSSSRFVRNLESVTERKLGESSIVMVQKLEWAQGWDEYIANNQVGKCIEHYDTAGRKTIDSFSLLGAVLSETQQLHYGSFIDWNSSSEVNDIQQAEKFTTQYLYDATGAILTETDCAGHQRRMTYDIAGFVKQSWLTLKGQSEQIILRALSYSAAGQKLREEQGNGLVITYEYEPETQRLLHVKTQRPQGHALGAKIMQDLRYEYDPVGNIICLKNDAEATRYWRNQKVVPENRYIYDSLYQLISASGRESANQPTPAAMQSQTITTLVKDTQSYTNYTRLYAYDRGGNLTQIRHNSPIAQQSFTQDIVVSNKTNRALLKSQCADPQQVDRYFDESGNLIKLLNGDAVIWDERNHLKATNQVIESGFLYEGETYQYNSTGQRVTKIRGRKAAYGNLEKVTTHYLPNIEIWEVNENPVTEKYVVAQVNAGTSAGVRALCWEIGSPKGIENNSLRYSYDNGVGNSGLETDGKGQLVSYEEYYPYGGTAIWSSENVLEADYKTIRYSGKEKDSTGMYYYGYRYYQPWIGRWLSADPAGTIDGLNLYRMVRNNPVTLYDPDGRKPKWLSRFLNFFKCGRGRSNSVEPSPIELNTTRESAIKPSTSGFLMRGLPTESRLATSTPGISGIETFIQNRASGNIWDNKRDENYTISELNLSERTKFKLFSTREGQSKNLIIFAHGHFDSRTRDINVPEGVTLNFLNPHDTTLAIENPSIVTVAAKRDYTFASVSNTGVTAKTKNAEKILAEKGLIGITGSSEPNKVKDYQLTPHIDYDDTVYGNAISLNRYAETIGYKIPTLKSDILTLDKSTPKTPLQVVLNGLKTKGINYDSITCSFCRSSENSPKYNIYNSTFIRK